MARIPQYHLYRNYQIRCPTMIIPYQSMSQQRRARVLGTLFCSRLP